MGQSENKSYKSLYLIGKTENEADDFIRNNNIIYIDNYGHKIFITRIRIISLFPVNLDYLPNRLNVCLSANGVINRMVDNG